MFIYVLKRLAEMIPVLLVVVVATFFLAHAVPGGPFDKERPMPAEVKKQVEAYYGLDQPLHVQLGNYIGNLAHGSLGPSMKYPGWTVNQIIGARIPVSVILGSLSLLIAILVGIPIGVIAASRPNTWMDRLPMGLALIGICVRLSCSGLCWPWSSRSSSAGSRRAVGVPFRTSCCRRWRWA